MKHILPTLLIVLLIAPAVSSAQDGGRKGGVGGGGLGVAPVARWSDGYFHEDVAALAVHLLGGYAWNDNDMIVLEMNGTAFASKEYNSEWLFGSDDLLTSQSFEGAAWYHYYGRPGRAFFSATGLGLFAFDRGRNYHSDHGAGYLLGGGYEFLRHFQFGLYLSGGRTFDAGRNFTHTNFSLLLTGIMY